MDILLHNIILVGYIVKKRILKKPFIGIKKQQNMDMPKHYEIARFYHMDKDLESAFYWYHKAAENGNIDARFNLATLYQEKNLENIFYLYQENEKGQFNLTQ